MWYMPAFDSPIGGHLSPEKVTYWFKRGHFEEPGDYLAYLLLLLVCLLCTSRSIKLNVSQDDLYL